MKKSNLKGHAKAWSDVGLGYLTNTLKTKALMHNVKYVEVSERVLKSTQTCSHCFALTGPRGRKGLGVSAWHCVKCGKLHNRNENNADNHRLVYKEALLNQRLESNGIKLSSDLSDINKVEQCPEKELKSKANLTLQDVEGSYEESPSL